MRKGEVILGGIMMFVGLVHRSPIIYITGVILLLAESWFDFKGLEDSK